MDIHTKFNRKIIDDRQIDTLIGLAKGITADDMVSQKEAEFLQTWLAQAYSSAKNPVISNLLERVTSMLEDGVLDNDESQELLTTLQLISGDKSELGELMKPTTLPLCTPPPPITIQDRNFLFTGTFAYGTRPNCHKATQELGGIPQKGLNKQTNYLVIGAYVTDSWKHENFGLKIKKATEMRDSGLNLHIISEEHWATSLSLT